MRRNFTKLLGVFGAMAALIGGGVSNRALANNAEVRTTQRDAIKEEIKVPRPVQMRKTISGFSENGLKPSNRFLNQRQYRKMCASNPHLRKSKKHRSKN